jgi:hypothetical protein
VEADLEEATDVLALCVRNGFSMHCFTPADAVTAELSTHHEAGSLERLAQPIMVEYNSSYLKSK